MREFWDARARENAMYYISSFRPYDEQDPEEFWRWGETLTARFLDESGLEFTGAERVLEIGCGIGRMTVPLARRFAGVEAVDVSEEMVRRACETLAGFPHAHACATNGTDLAEYADGAFDFVFSYLVLQHVPDPAVVRGYLREIARVLRPGGACHLQLNGEEGADAPWIRRIGAGARRVARRTREAATGALRAVRRAAPRGPTGLDSPAWRGSRLPAAEARRVCAEAGLRVTRLAGEGTQYMWLTAVRETPRA
jgi:SAM-dependent methyltransferase